MRMMRCTASLSVHLVGTDVTEHFWPGLEVNFDRELKPATETTPAYTVADAVAGREDCFVDASEPFITAAADEGVALPAGTVIALEPPAPKE